jgi:hypothetical protein
VDELGDEVGDLLLHLAAQEDGVVVEEPGVDVKRALTAGGLLDDHRNEGHADLLLLRVANVQPITCGYRSKPATFQLRIDGGSPDD